MKNTSTVGSTDSMGFFVGDVFKVATGLSVGIPVEILLGT